MLKLREGLRVVYKPNLWDSFTSTLPKGLTGTVSKQYSLFNSFYCDPGKQYVNVLWDNGKREGVTKDSLEVIN